MACGNGCSALRRLQDAERAEELQRVREKVEFLEEELRKTRASAPNARAHNEAEDLRKELMEYVARRSKARRNTEFEATAMAAGMYA
eukprot:Skav230045  [mRNA]  locus=scaffold465:306078:307009:+ [translate_table: standard]